MMFCNYTTGQQTSSLITLSEKINTNVRDVHTQVSELHLEMDALRQKVISMDDLKVTQHLPKARKKMPEDLYVNCFICSVHV